MSPVFSAMTPFSREQRPPQHMELQLLPDSELVDIWEQTQRAAWALEEKGWDIGPALHYSGVVVWEMQRRLSRLPQGRPFGLPAPSAMEDLNLPDGFPRIVTIGI